MKQNGSRSDFQNGNLKASLGDMMLMKIAKGKDKVAGKRLSQFVAVREHVISNPFGVKK